MYKLEYLPSNRLLTAVWQIGDLNGRILQSNLPPEILVESLLTRKKQDILQLAFFLGANITLKQAEQIANSEFIEMDLQQYQILTNLRSVIEFNRSSLALQFTTPEVSSLLQLNRIFLTGWQEVWKVQTRRQVAELEQETNPFAKSVDITFPEDKIDSQILEFASWYRTRTDVLPIIKIGILAYLLLRVKPLLVFSDLTVVMLLDLLLFKEGQTQVVPVPLVELFLRNYIRISNSLESTAPGNLTPWLELWCELLFTAQQEQWQVFSSKALETQEKNKKQPFLDLNQRQLKVLKYLQNITTVKREDYCQMFDVSTMTAFRDLDDLVVKKLIKSEGKGRATRYKLASR